MNFHKTIGFLATLLLIVGLGVPDSFAQTGTMKLEFSEQPISVLAGTDNAPGVRLRLTLDPAPDAATTVSVSLSLAPAFQMTRDASVDPATPIASGSSVNITVGTDGTGESEELFIIDNNAAYIDYSYWIARVAQQTITAGGESVTYPRFHTRIFIKDAQRPTATNRITIEASLPSINANAGGQQTVTLTVTMDPAPETGVSLVMQANHIKPDGNWDFGLSSDPSDVNISANATEGTTVYDFAGAANIPEGIVRVHASSRGYNTATLDIPVIARSAGDAEGFRVVIASPGNEDWVGIDGEVEVHVMRVSRHAYDWTRFTSIAVSLRDTTDTAPNAYTELSATLNDASPAVPIVSTMTAANLNEARYGIIETNNEDVTYDRATDKLVFKFELGEDDKATPTAADYKGVYAAAVFASSGDGTPLSATLNSNDAKKNVFTSASLLNGVSAANKKVGDGKLIQVDVVRPADSDEFDASSLTVNVNGDPATRTTKVKVGDEIDAELAVSGAVRFRDENIRLAIIPVDAMTAGGKDITFASATYGADDIADASGRSLGISLDVAAGTFTLRSRTASIIKNRDTGKNLGNNKPFEVDGLEIVARINTIDQAGNVSETGVSSVAFTGDSRKPKISVIHPAAGDHFSAIYENARDLEDYDEYLMPLVVRVDEEDLAKLEIYAVGAAAAATRVDLLDTNISDTVGQASANTVGDTLSYDTSALLYPTALQNKRTAGTLPGGAKITLKVEATDASGNKTVMTIANVMHDEVSPAITAWFPKQSLLEMADDGSYLINNTTRHPTLTLPEAVDSISVTYESRGSVPIVETVSGMTAKGDKEVTMTDMLEDGRTYTLTIFTRDMAGNTAISGGEELKFDASFANPMANAFKVLNRTNHATDPTKASAGVIAGQAFELEIMAVDGSGTDARNVYTYKNDMASKVLISAWSGGGAASSVMFSGDGVTDNGDGSATLNAADWNLGKRTVYAESEMAIDAIKILVQHLDAADAEVFMGSVDGLYVDAADFKKFNVIAYQPDKATGVEVTDVNPGSFELEIIPADAFGNPSVKAFAADPGSVADSLALLDEAVAKNNAANIVFDGIPVTFASSPNQDDLFLGDNIPADGSLYVLETQGRSSVRVNISIADDELEPSNARTADIKIQRVSFSVVDPLMPVLTLWVPNVEGDQAGNDVTIPAGADDIMVTVNAEGYEAGSMVTFTKNGTAMDAVAANDDGTASLMITMSEAGTVTVSATDGRAGTGDLAITFVVEPDEPMRMDYTDANGAPVYLIDLTDMTYTVDLGDYTLFRTAWGKMKGDDLNGDGADDTDVQIFLQSDIVPLGAPDGMVNLDDYTEFITSWGRTADMGSMPSSKPIVLLPGINENAEFSLSLGSERVVAGEMVAVDVSLANVEALVSYGFTLNYDTDKFEFVSVAPADEDMLKSTGGDTPMFFHRLLADGQVEVANGLVNGTAVSGGGDIVRFVFRVLYEFEDNARFEIANGLVFDPTSLSNPAVVAGVLELQSTPREFALHQNFPNPFNPDTTIKYDLAESSDVTLQIYNVLGQVVRTLVASEAQNAGRYQIRWNGMDDRGVPVSSGVYFYQISADGKFQQVQKLMLLK